MRNAGELKKTLETSNDQGSQIGTPAASALVTTNAPIATPESSFITLCDDGVASIAVGHISLGLPTFHVFDKNRPPSDLTNSHSLKLGRGDTARTLVFQVRNQATLSQINERYGKQKAALETMLAELRQELSTAKRLLIVEQQKSKPPQAHSIAEPSKKDIQKTIKKMTSAIKSAQDALAQGIIEPLAKSEMRPVSLYAQLMGENPHRALSLPYFHNKYRRDEHYLPFKVTSQSNGMIGGYVYPWANDNAANENLQFKNFVTAGCLFGSSVHGLDDLGHLIPLIKHDIALYPNQKISYIVNQRASLYETLQFIQLDLLAGLMRRLSQKVPDTRVVYHLPYFDYVLFGIGLFLKNQMTRAALTSFIESIYTRKEEHSALIKKVFNENGILNVIIESPFCNLFNPEKNTVEHFIDAIYSSFPFLNNIEADNNRDFHQNYINAIKQHYPGLIPFLEEKATKKHDKKDKDKRQAKEKFLNESKITSKANAKLAAANSAREKAQSEHGSGWNVQWDTVLRIQFEKNWETSLSLAWEESWPNSSEKQQAETEWNEEQEPIWGQDWNRLWDASIREEAFVRLCLTRLSNNSYHMEQRALWIKYSGVLGTPTTIEDLFGYANPIMVARSAEGSKDYETCSILPATEKQIQVGYLQINKPLQPSKASPQIVNLTLLDSPAYAPSNLYDGRAFYFTAPQIAMPECSQQIRAYTLKAMHVASTLSVLPQANSLSEAEQIEALLNQLKIAVAESNEALLALRNSKLHVIGESSSSAATNCLVDNYRKMSGTDSSETASPPPPPLISIRKAPITKSQSGTI